LEVEKTGVTVKKLEVGTWLVAEQTTVYFIGPPISAMLNK